MPVPEEWVQVIRGPLPKSVHWPRAPKDGKPQQQQPGATQQGRWRQPHVQGRQGSHRHRRQGSERRTPTRRLPWHKSAFPSWRRHSELWGRRRHSSQSREALKRARQQAVPLSIPDKVAQCESFLERARKREAAARELLLQAQTGLSEEVVEGEQRLATLRAELERPQSPVVSVDMSAEVQRLRALVEQLSKEKEDVCPQTDPNPKRVCRREDFIPQCEEEMQEWIQGRQRDLQAHRGRPSLRSGEDLPTHVFSSTGVAGLVPLRVWAFWSAIWPQHNGKSAQVSTSLQMTSVWYVVTLAGTLQLGQHSLMNRSDPH